MNNTQSVSATPDRRRRRVIRALLVLGLTLGSIAMTARPADAAGYVLTCYTRLGPNPSIISGFNVELWAWDGISFYSARKIDQGHTAANGCVGWFIPPQYQSAFLYTMVNHFAVYYYRGWSYSSNFWWQPTTRFYSVTDIGYPNWEGHAFPGDHIWYLPGVFWCEPSFGGPC